MSFRNIRQPKYKLASIIILVHTDTEAKIHSKFLLLPYFLVFKPAFVAPGGIAGCAGRVGGGA